MGGTFSSGRMETRSGRERSNDDNLAAILHFLIRSGQVHIFSPEDVSDDEIVAPTTPPRIETQPNTKLLDISEISLKTKQCAGLLHSRSKKRPYSVISMCSARENGMFGNGAFTAGDKCRITNSYLPYNIEEVEVYGNKAFCGTYSSDGQQLLTACQDRFIRLYYTKGNRFKMYQKIQARDVGWSILDTAFSPDGQWLAYSSWSESLHLCRLSDPENQETLPLCPEDRRFCVFSIVFSADGSEILGGANDGFLYVYNRECNQRALRIEGHSDDVNTVAFADNTSHILYSGGDDGLCKVWDRRTLNECFPKPVGVLAGHRDGITFIDPKGDGTHFISNSKDQSIKLWDVRNFSTSDAQVLTRQAVSGQNWDYRWQKVPKKLSNTKGNLKGDTSIMTYRSHSVLQTLIRCRFSPMTTTGQRYIYTGCSSGRVVIYDVLTGKVVKVLSGHRGCVRDVTWHPFQSEIVSTSWDQSVICWRNIRQNIDNEDTIDEKKDIVVRRSARIAEKLQRRKKILLFTYI
uniref:DDB1- and CUL4-associated factor 11 n=1 Tax=Clastoptera arizonana TaxID=38151 RepID=A0A1B6CJX3_9HEMI